MPDFSSWSLQNLGTRVYDMDQQTKMLNNLTAQKMQGEIASQPAHMEMLKAQITNYSSQALEHGATARLKGMEADIMQRERDNLNKMAANQQAKQVAGGPTPEADARSRSIEGSLSQAADLTASQGLSMLESGVPTLGRKYIDEALNITTKLSQVRRNREQQHHAASSAVVNEAKIIQQSLGSIMPGPDAEARFEAAKTAVIAQMPDMSAEDRKRLLALSYSPQVVQDFRNKAISATDAERIKMQAAENKSKDDARKERARLARLDRSEEQITMRERIHAEQARTKVAGDKPLKDITPEFRKQTELALYRAIFPEKSFLGKESKLGLDPKIQAQLDNSVQSVLEDIQTRMMENKALTGLQARSQAIVEEQKYWPMIIKAWNERGKSGRVYTGGGDTPEQATPVPMNRKDMRIRKYYSKGGKVYKWNGKVGMLVGSDRNIEEPNKVTAGSIVSGDTVSIPESEPGEGDPDNE